MPEKKLIIDEDWKTQVQAEKEAAVKISPDETAAARSRATRDASQPATAAPAGRPAEFQMPPASLEMLVTTLATEALVALGQVPHPATGELRAERNQAQYIIDTVDVLRQKTQGNLTPDEQQMIDSVLHQLRLVFLETAGGPSTVSN
jgi:hypothetical protein